MSITNRKYSEDLVDLLKILAEELQDRNYDAKTFVNDFLCYSLNHVVWQLC